MDELLAWFADHEKLSGWAQAFGALLALFVALGVVSLQARYAARQDDRRTAERIRSLARTLQYWRDICLNSYALRQHESQHQDVLALHANLHEFNHTASEINKFAFVDAPSQLVFRALTKYRGMCGPLSQFMNPEYKVPLQAAELKEFDRILEELSEMTRGLFADANRISN